MSVPASSAFRRSPLFAATRLAPRNRLLAALPESEYAQLAPLFRRDQLEIRQVVADYDKPIERVYFPETCVVSLVGAMRDGAAVEIASIGNEGFVGHPIFLGADRMAGQAFCQAPGEAVSLSVDEFRQAVARGGRFPVLLGRYVQALFTFVSQSSACNRIHALRERCARWLLLTHDRVGANEFPLPQLSLAQMLGVRRASVNDAATALQRLGHIVYAHGRMTIRDRHGLEAATCECYRIIRRELDRLLDGHDSADPLAGVRVSELGKSTLTDASSDEPARDDIKLR
ncbi:MAG: Crp/Fnr family transcriptional regulator [Gemmatimonadaceae bacterium]